MDRNDCAPIDNDICTYIYEMDIYIYIYIHRYDRKWIDTER